MTATRLSAAQRRELILQAAGRAFSRGGYAGTSTDVVAHEAGVSQPYVVRMFGTKADLFQEVFDRAACALLTAFAEELADPAVAASPEVWERLGAVYNDLVEDRDVLVVLLQGFSAAAGHPQIAAAARTFVSSLFTLVVERTGCTPQRAREFIANGMLLNALLAMNATGHADGDPALAALAACALGQDCEFDAGTGSPSR
ncbi:TetR/AcrR family transcriptional regulator [Nocardia puris]|uniref:TetR family transcriptional regulator n=1 Tax=Nocardia puris TaxID=208602 RepID=A0A366D3A2_9NOCA|nr:TetR/AcrR family transcriptional regulator [Nocardia puris]MBF6214824.1 TetR/AcrR family transcriptional regulator [Nocardia puris]MBF6364167.1 TetR/AcrR family transcriptional regulator [Nocardia puris]MBF6459096.1 TetR/AcrR family transcriptional regulator [Nocardia puris]RBO84550.1 TetR family transcriptional regulator [Nocardia puris]